MYCPQCKAEYRQGFTRCSDCDVELVENYLEAARHPLAKKVAVGGRVRGAIVAWDGSSFLCGTDGKFPLSENTKNCEPNEP